MVGSESPEGGECVLWREGLGHGFSLYMACCKHSLEKHVRIFSE